MGISSILVSIIVPVYNETNYLGKCIESIQCQKYENIEIILVDDGSTNEAANICDFHASQDHRISVIHQENGGLSAARISGLDASTGEWIMFVDNDDIISPYIVSDLMQCVNEKIDIVAGQRLDTDSPEAYIFQPLTNNGKIIVRGCEVVEQIPEDKQINIITPMWGKIYRREFLLKTNPSVYKKECPIIYFEDVLMTPILYNSARTICLVKNVYYVHREVPDSISRSGRISEFYLNQIESGKILIEYCKRNKLQKYYAYQLSIYFQSILRLWCLLDESNCEKTKLGFYRNKILENANKYKKEYLKNSSDSNVKKLCMWGFFFNRTIWTIVVKKLYFRK